MLSRDFARLEWPFRPILAHLERQWAQRVDRVLTVNDPYADLIARQLRVPRPPIVMNTPARWLPPDPAPDLIREATGLPAEVSIVLYQGQLTTERGIEQAMDAILQVPGAVLALLGFGSREGMYRAMAEDPPYAGRVILLPAVPPSELLAWTASADVMVMPIQPTTPNRRVHDTPEALGSHRGRRARGGVGPAGDGGRDPDRRRRRPVRSEEPGVDRARHPAAC